MRVSDRLAKFFMNDEQFLAQKFNIYQNTRSDKDDILFSFSKNKQSLIDLKDERLNPLKD